MQSPFIWHDLATTDPKAAAEFYTAVVGWTLGTNMPGMDYTILQAAGVGVGGIMPMPPATSGMAPRWNGYIYVADVDATAAKAVTLGGRIFQPGMDIPGIGRFAVIADPTGATFILLSPIGPDESSGEVPEGTPGKIGWCELHSGDWKQAWDFYQALFGWTAGESMDMGPMGHYQQFKVGDKAIGGMMNKLASDPAPPHWNYYINVDGIDAAFARVKANGGKPFFEPHQVPGGFWIVMAMDPQGASFCLLSKTR